MAQRRGLEPPIPLLGHPLSKRADYQLSHRCIWRREWEPNPQGPEACQFSKLGSIAACNSRHGGKGGTRTLRTNFSVRPISSRGPYQVRLTFPNKKKQVRLWLLPQSDLLSILNMDFRRKQYPETICSVRSRNTFMRILVRLGMANIIAIELIATFILHAFIRRPGKTHVRVLLSCFCGQYIPNHRICQGLFLGFLRFLLRAWISGAITLTTCCRIKD